MRFGKQKEKYRLKDSVVEIIKKIAEPVNWGYRDNADRFGRSQLHSASSQSFAGTCSGRPEWLKIWEKEIWGKVGESKLNSQKELTCWRSKKQKQSEPEGRLYGENAGWVGQSLWAPKVTLNR
jgi:hypothetical protein